MARGDAQKYPSEAFVRYRLLRETRRGGMSQIWEAIDTQTGRRVAVKRLSVPTTLTPTERRAWMAQIERTAQAIGRLKHPNIAAIYDVGQENWQPFLVMDLLPGQTLRQRLREGPLPPGEAARVLSQAAAALDAAHDAGLAHGGLKPASVRLLPNGTVKLTDFGIARQGDSRRGLPTELTATATMTGSPSYLSPEQIQGSAFNSASDVWALGVILYEMLAGRTPFSGSRMEDVLEQIIAADPPPTPRMPPAIQTVLNRALAKDPAQRYGRAGEMAAALQSALPPMLPAAPTLSLLRPFRAAARSVPALSGLPKPLGVGRRVLLTLAGVSLLAMLFLEIYASHAPSPPPPDIPKLTTESILPQPQPTASSDAASPFTPVPAAPVILPVNEPPAPAKKRRDDAKPKG